MVIQPKIKTSNVLDITYNISNPQNMIENTNDNIHNVMPKIDTNNYHNSLGVLETGNVSMDLSQPVQLKVRKKKKISNKTKRKKSKNTHMARYKI